MTLAETLELIRAGYSKADIESLETPVPTDPKPTDPTPAPTDPKPTDPTPAPTDPKPAVDNSAVLEALNKLTAAIQAGNLTHDKQPTNPPITMDDLIKGV